MLCGRLRCACLRRSPQCLRRSPQCLVRSPIQQACGGLREKSYAHTPVYVIMTAECFRSWTTCLVVCTSQLILRPTCPRTCSYLKARLTCPRRSSLTAHLTCPRRSYLTARLTCPRRCSSLTARPRLTNVRALCGREPQVEQCACAVWERAPG